MKKFFFPMLLLLLSPQISFAQQPVLQPENFILTGDAITTGENCFRLTPAELWTGGTIWYKDAMDMSHPFEVELEANFGCSDEGADGIVFILHSQLRTGQQGEGMGFGGLSPSFGVEMDTYQNYHLADPRYDHVAFIKNGSVNHEKGVGQPKPIFSDERNIEDCQAHQINISWNPDFNNIRFSVDGVVRLNVNHNVIKNIFNDNPNVFWGFSSATGGMYNEHSICLKKVTYEQVSQLDLKTISEIVDGQFTILNNLLMSNKESALSETALAELDKLGHLMQSHPDHVLNLQVFTDNTLGAQAANKLTQKQGELIRDYLVKRGIKAKRIDVVGYGEKFPIAPNDNEEGRAKNRRVEVSMTKNKA